MGRKKTYVSATVVSLVTDTPNIIQQSVLTSIAYGTDIASDLVTNMTTGLASDLHSYYHIANNNRDKADLFLSSGQSYYSTSILTIQSVLENIHGTRVTITKCSLEPLDTDFLAYEYMASKYGFNLIDGSFKSLPNGLPVATTVFNNSILNDGALLIEYANELGTVIYTETTSITGINTADRYYHILYYVEGSGTLRYWNYNTTTDTYSFLTPNDFNYKNDYYPVVPIIQYGENIVEDDYLDTEQYKLSKTLLNKLGLKIQNISDSLKEDENYDTIEQAHFIPSVRIQDTDQLALKYLYHHFDTQFENQKYTEASFNEWLDIGSDTGTQPPTNTLEYRMSAFKLDISWYYITKKVVNKSWSGEEEYARYYQVKGNTTVGDAYMQSTYNDSTVTLIRKINNAQQEELTIVGLSQTNYIDNKYSISWNVGRIFKSEGTEDDPEPMVIPISPAIVRTIFPRLVDRNIFCYRTYVLVLSFKKTIKLKWYQTGIFKFVMVVVAIVLTVWSAGTLSSSMSAAYSAAIAGGATIAGGLIAAGIVALNAAFWSAVTGYAMRMLLEQFGWETAALIAIVATVFMYSRGVFGSVDGLSVSSMVDDIGASISDYFKDELAQELSIQAELQAEYSAYEEDYATMMEEMFGLSDSYAEVYKRYSQDTAIYSRMSPSTFYFMAVDALILSPEISTAAIDNFVDNAVAATSEYDIM